MIKIAFICTENSARSQMAEGYAKHFANLYKMNIEVFSAGSNPAPSINPLAIKVMAEEGIDLSYQRPKSFQEIPFDQINLVITLCGDGKETCPYVPAHKREHWGLPDPVKVEGTEEERLKIFRKVRDEIKEKVKNLILSLKNS
nr:arsenate reductase ArsC [Thermodesulfobacterium hveragerdense]